VPRQRGERPRAGAVRAGGSIKREMIPAPGANAAVKQVFRARFLVARLPKQLRQPRY
jgi:hypothetical protein